MFDRSPTDSVKRKPPHTYLDYENSADHVELTERLCKTLYYGYNTPPDYPSLPLSGIAVKFFQDAAPRSLGKVDMYLASSMTKHAMMSPCSVMLGIIYVNRLKDKNPEYLMQISSADLFLISMMMASKYLYDEGVYEEVFNEDWAVVGMMETAEINQLEQNFLAALDWRLMVHDHEFKQYLDTIEKKIAFHESCKRGWLSYTDVWTLTQGSYYGDICKYMGQELAKMFAVSTVAYVAGVLTLLTSSYLAVSMSSRLTTLTQQPISYPELPVDFPEIPSFDTVSSINIFGMRKEVDCDLPAIRMPSPIWPLPSSVSSLSSFLYQMMVVSSLEYVSYGFPVDMNLLWRQSDKGQPSTPTSDTLQQMNNQKTEKDLFISSGKISQMKPSTASILNDKHALFTTNLESASRQAILTPSSSINSDSQRSMPENKPLVPSQISNSSSWSPEKDLIGNELPRSKYPAISTAILNLVTLLSLKTSSSSQESAKEVGHCKRCEHARRAATHVSADVKSRATAVPLPNCSRTSASSKGNLLSKCSWSRWHTEKKRSNDWQKKQLASNTDPTESKNVPSQSSPVMAPFTLSSSSYPSFFYNAGSTSSAFVPRYYQNNHTLYSLPTQNDSEDARPPNGHFQPTSLIDDVDWFNNQSLSPDRVRLLCLAANFLKGRRVKEKLGVATSARETNTRVFAPESCTGMASSGLRFSNRANMVACHC